MSFSVSRGVSVSIPTFNRADSLRRLVDSVDSQMYDNISLVIYDNASSDQNQKSYLQHLDDQKLGRVVRSKLPIGPILNIKRAIKTDSADYNALVADDMYVERTYIHELLECISSTKGAILAYSGVFFHSGNNVFPHYDPYVLDQETFEERLKSLAQNLRKGSAIYGLYDSSYTPLLDAFYPEDHSHRLGDFAFLMKVLNYGKIVQVKNPLIHRDLDPPPTNFNAHIERTRQGGINSSVRLSAPRLEAIHEVYLWLVGVESNISGDKAGFSKLICSVLLRKYLGDIKLEIARLSKLVSRELYFASWEDDIERHSDLQVEEVCLRLLMSLYFLKIFSSDSAVSDLISIIKKKLN